MNILILFVVFAVSLTLEGCSKSNQNPAASNNESEKKTLSGIFRSSLSQDDDNYMRYDFRTDGTVIFEGRAHTSIDVANSPIQILTEANGKGIYKIEDDKVTSVVLLIPKAIYPPNYSEYNITGDIQTNIVLFRIDGEDLIHLSEVVDGSKTNIDDRQIRYVRKR